MATEYLDQTWGMAGNFESVPKYVRDGDYVVHFFKPDLCYAERIDDLLTVYKAEGSGELVGCKIKGVSELLEHVIAFIGLTNGKVEMGWLFLSAVGSSPAKTRYYELSRMTKGKTVDVSAAMRRAA